MNFSDLSEVWRSHLPQPLLVLLCVLLIQWKLLCGVKPPPPPLPTALQWTQKEDFYLSYRINDEWSFDDSIANYGCRVYAFDPTMRKENHLRSPFIQFFKVGLADFDSEGTPGESGKAAWRTRTLKSIITELRHNKASADFL